MAVIRDDAEALCKKPTKANWERFRKSMAGSRLSYYVIRYGNGRISKKEDLRDAHAELYDSGEKFVARVPVIMEDGRKVRGATIYLKGLLNLNRK